MQLMMRSLMSTVRVQTLARCAATRDLLLVLKAICVMCKAGEHLHVIACYRLILVLCSYKYIVYPVG